LPKILVIAHIFGVLFGQNLILYIFINYLLSVIYDIYQKYKFIYYFNILAFDVILPN